MTSIITIYILLLFTIFLNFIILRLIISFDKVTMMNIIIRIMQKCPLFSYLQFNSEPAEDNETIEAHLCVLQLECQKSSPNSTIISEKLPRTFAYREKIVHDKLLCDVLNIFPCFLIEKEVRYHYSILVYQQLVIIYIYTNNLLQVGTKSNYPQ